MADTLRRLQGLATQSNLTLLRFTPAPQKQLPLYTEVPYTLTAEGSYHNLGAVLRSRQQVPAHHQRRRHLDRPRKPAQDPNSTIIADLHRHDLRAQRSGRGRGGRGAPPAR